MGRAFPGIAQTIFAKVHASDVVEASEPAWARSLFVKEASWAHHASVMQRIKIVAALDIEDRVPSITQPVLLVRGADDTFTGHTTARLRSLLRRVDVVTLPGGHLPHVAARDFVLFNGDDEAMAALRDISEDEGLSSRQRNGSMMRPWDQRRDQRRALIRLLVMGRRLIELRLWEKFGDNEDETGVEAAQDVVRRPWRQSRAVCGSLGGRRGRSRPRGVHGQK